MSEIRTVAQAAAAIQAHEALCAERYAGIREDISDLKNIVKGAGKMIAGLAVALIAWGAGQIYTDLKNPRQPTAAVTVLTPPAR